MAGIGGMTVEELGRRHGALLEAIIDKAIADPAWKEKLLSNPQAALDEAGFVAEIDALNPATWEDVEVTGQMLRSGYYTGFLCTLPITQCDWR